jgi:hypothetical protein
VKRGRTRAEAEAISQLQSVQEAADADHEQPSKDEGLAGCQCKADSELVGMLVAPLLSLQRL